MFVWLFIGSIRRIAPSRGQICPTLDIVVYTILDECWTQQMSLNPIKTMAGRMQTWKRGRGGGAEGKGWRAGREGIGKVGRE
jgi:hypothetical protein